jgi:hypothetical protein
VAPFDFTQGMVMLVSFQPLVLAGTPLPFDFAQGTPQRRGV